MTGFKSVKVSELVPGNSYFVRHPFWGLLQNVTYVGILGKKLEFTFGNLENKDKQFNFLDYKSNLKIFKEV